MLSCRDIVGRCDEAIAGELSWGQRLRWRLHLAMCRHCRRFVRQYAHMLALLAARPEPASDREVEAVLERVRRERAAPGPH